VGLCQKSSPTSNQRVVLFLGGRKMAYRLLAQGSFWMTNKKVAKRFDLETATFLAELVTKYLHHKDRGELKSGGWFFYTSEDLEEATTLSYHKQKRCLSLLEEAGFVEQKLIGVPARLHFKIIEYQISKFLNTGVEKNSKLYNKKDIIIKNNKEDNAQAKLERDRFRKLKIEKEEEEFDKFWDMYQKKVGKDSAKKLWSKISKKDKEVIFDHTPRYVKSTPDKTFRKDPTTYLRNRGWEDEIIETKKNDFYEKNKPFEPTLKPNDPRGFSTI